MRQNKSITIICLILTFGLTAPAQDLITDRPDYTESAFAVNARTVQVESGTEWVDFETHEEFSYPNVLARIGIGYNTEIRLGLPGWTNVMINDRSKSYFNDLILEAKYQFINDDAELPVAVLLVSTLPTGDDAVSVGTAEIGIKSALSYNINNSISLGWNVGAISVDDGDARKFLFLKSIAFGVALNERLGLFIETFAETLESETWQPFVDGGFTYLVFDEVQLDFYLGKGLNDYTSDLIIGAGLSFLVGY